MVSNSREDIRAMSAAIRKQPERGWRDKFRDAFRGLWLAMRDQISFRVHLTFAVSVVIMAALLKVSVAEWCLLVLCISTVLAAETFNTALEWMAKAIDRRENPRLGGALDIASAAVLISAIGAAVVGTTVFVYRLGLLLVWWAP
jgi:diacylglycerol kinase